jgi:circadian clock protein KaiB
MFDMAATDYVFRLFVAGDEPNSRLAKQNLHALCDEYLPGRHHIEVVDVLQDFDAALKAHVMVVPALVVAAPHTAIFYGTLADKSKVLAALALEGGGHQP